MCIYVPLGNESLTLYKLQVASIGLSNNLLDLYLGMVDECLGGMMISSYTTWCLKHSISNCLL